jgi:amino acid adenylation domain-containing protein
VRVREVCLGAYAHQDVPFEKLVEELQPARELSHHPLFQVMLALQNAPTTADVNMKGLELRRIEVENNTAKFDLLLVMEGDGPELQGMIEYSAELFEPGTMQRLLGHYERLLAELVKDPEQRLWQVQMLGDSEREQVLFEWNQERLDFPDDCSIHDLIEAQAQRTPQATALIFGKQRLSYQELNIRANQLAHYLRRLHIGPESLVGVCLQRSPEMVIALLGILKAGGAYVPLDPAYPKERLSLILKDSEAEVLLTQRSLVESLPAHEVKVICLDAEATTLAEQSEQTPKVAMSAHNLAYLIYTSGSTGRPKGAAIEHRSAVALLHWARQFYSDAELDGVLASTSICFDLSVFELFAPLSWGGKVMLVENALSLGGISEAVRLINTVPSAMAELVRLGAVPETAKTINLAGEPISPALVDQVYEQLGVERIYNLYGPSEDTTYSSVAQVERAGRKSPPIGRAIANTQLYIVDGELELSPVGAYGEICLGGEGLARGYHGRSEQTAERFVPNPYSQQGGRRLYRTGDIGRNRADGVVEYVGRADHQVKVRGYRIELGEVEAVLREQEWVSEAVVLVREDEPGDKRLVAYLAADGAAEDGAGAKASELRLATLRQYAKERLPEYMVPAAYVLLNELPLTPTGKVDRKALPAPERSRSQLAAEYISPSTNMERSIHAIWQDLLQTEQIGVHDNFFDLGGHSLLLIQVLVRLRAAIGHEVALIEVFQYPTIHSLATHLSRKRDVPLASQSTEELVEKLKEGKGRLQQRLSKVKSLESQGNLK